MPQTKSLLLKAYALLTVLESAFAFYFLSSIPSNAGNAVLAGYSTSRLLLMMGTAIPFLVFGLFFAAISTSRTRLNRVVSFVDTFLEAQWKRLAVTTVSSMLMFAGILLLLLPPARLGDFALIAERLAPLVYLGGLLGAQTLLVQHFWRGQRLHFQHLNQWKLVFTVAGILFALALAVAAWSSWSGIGIKPEKYGWHAPGTPILSIQLLSALCVSLLFLVFRDRIEKSNLWKNRRLSIKFETLVFIALWLAAFLIWNGEPVRRASYFSPTPAPPNFESYPYSDAGFYDTLAQSILIGQGRTLQVILRPLYIFLLTTFHLIGGQGYSLILVLQTLLLAFLPALLFLLGSRMGNQTAGMLSALLLIFRERNSIALTNILEVSHSKLLLADMTTTLFVLLTVFTLVNWLRKTNTNHLPGLVAGASFGLSILARSQTQVLLPILLLGILFSGGALREWRKALQRTLVFGLGLLLIVAPWIWRNYQVSGKPVIENSGFYIRLFASGYVEPTDSIDRRPNESFDDYSARMKAQIVRYVLNHPVEIAGVYSTYFIHNEICSVVYLPMSLRFYDLYSYVKQFPLWEPYSDLTGGREVMFFLALGVIAVGVGTAFRKLGFLGLLPLLIHLTYSLSIVTARISGWRYLMPVDWIPQIYYSIGLIQLVWMVASVVWNKTMETAETNNMETRPTFSPGKTGLAAAGFLLIGLSLPFMEWAMPVRYPYRTPNELIELNAGSLQPGITAPALKSFLETDPNAIVAYGRALYPSWYKEGSFWGESSPNLVAASQFDRIQFTLIGPVQAFTYLPLEDAPEYFPHAADVFVVGCRQKDFIRALIVKVNDQTLVASPWDGLTCPTGE